MEKQNNLAYFVLCAVLLLFFMAFFKIIGLRIILGLTLMIIPAYLLLKAFNLSLEESLIYSLFLTLTFFPVCVYYVGILIGSIRWAMGVVFIVLLFCGVLINTKKDEKNAKE